ncbi:hypothetical protein CEXT_690461 [Caerostris extrusa]|uniref:Uncharacterized protein n=1 Tax=Caerostris extrusa TaxID=172846 RepID=A0AAV4MMJ5_CAEEX|nr:hypothetical protein CEXT_690461 [Caerostris extrusa]
MEDIAYLCEWDNNEGTKMKSPKSESKIKFLRRMKRLDFSSYVRGDVDSKNLNRTEIRDSLIALGLSGGIVSLTKLDPGVRRYLAHLFTQRNPALPPPPNTITAPTARLSQY